MSRQAQTAGGAIPQLLYTASFRNRKGESQFSPPNQSNSHALKASYRAETTQTRHPNPLYGKRSANTPRIPEQCPKYISVFWEHSRGFSSGVLQGILRFVCLSIFACRVLCYSVARHAVLNMHIRTHAHTLLKAQASELLLCQLRIAMKDTMT